MGVRGRILEAVQAPLHKVRCESDAMALQMAWANERKHLTPTDERITELAAFAMSGVGLILKQEILELIELRATPLQELDALYARQEKEGRLLYTGVTR